MFDERREKKDCVFMCQLVSYKYSLYTNNSLHHVNNHSLDDTQRLPEVKNLLH